MDQCLVVEKRFGKWVGAKPDLRDCTAKPNKDNLGEIWQLIEDHDCNIEHCQNLASCLMTEIKEWWHLNRKFKISCDFSSWVGNTDENTSKGDVIKF